MWLGCYNPYPFKINMVRCFNDIIPDITRPSKWRPSKPCMAMFLLTCWPILLVPLKLPQLIKKNLLLDQCFKVGDWVMLRLQPYKQNPLCMEQSLKLAHWFYGPFQVVKTIGTIACELQLPSTAHRHPTFHISNSMLSREHHLLPFQIWQLIYWALTLIYALLNYWALRHYKLLKDFKIKSSFNGRILMS